MMTTQALKGTRTWRHAREFQARRWSRTTTTPMPPPLPAHPTPWKIPCMGQALQSPLKAGLVLLGARLSPPSNLAEIANASVSGRQISSRTGTALHPRYAKRHVHTATPVETWPQRTGFASNLMRLRRYQPRCPSACSSSRDSSLRWIRGTK